MNTDTINKTPKIIGLRSTIFLNTSIGYNAENEMKFKKFLPNGVPGNVFLQSHSNFGIGREFGSVLNDSWQLEDKNRGYNIVFLPNKVDIISSENKQETNIKKFIDFSINVFNAILQKETSAVRLAFSPTFVYDPDDGFDIDNCWKKIMKDTFISGNRLKDINIQYLIKHIWKEDENAINVNFSHLWSTAYKADTVNNKVVECVTLTLDINTAPQSGRTFSIEQMEKYFIKSMSWVEDLLKSY